MGYPQVPATNYLPFDEMVVVTAGEIHADWVTTRINVQEAIERAVRAGVRLARTDALPQVSGLTSRQRELLAFIETYVKLHGFCPSYDEMAKAIGLAAKSGILRMLQELEARHVIERASGRRRAVNLLARAYDVRHPEEVTR